MLLTLVTYTDNYNPLKVALMRLEVFLLVGGMLIQAHLVIQWSITIGTTGNATDFGDLSQANTELAATSDGVTRHSRGWL